MSSDRRAALKRRVVDKRCRLEFADWQPAVDEKAKVDKFQLNFPVVQWIFEMVQCD